VLHSIGVGMVYSIVVSDSKWCQSWQKVLCGWIFFVTWFPMMYEVPHHFRVGKMMEEVLLAREVISASLLRVNKRLANESRHGVMSPAAGWPSW